MPPKAIRPSIHAPPNQCAPGSPGARTRISPSTQHAKPISPSLAFHGFSGGTMKAATRKRTKANISRIRISIETPGNLNRATPQPMCDSRSTPRACYAFRGGASITRFTSDKTLLRKIPVLNLQDLHAGAFAAPESPENRIAPAKSAQAGKSRESATDAACIIAP